MNRQRHFGFKHSPMPVLALMVALVGGMPTGQAADNWNVDGEHGELHVHGWLLEGACRLDMRSIHQEVSMGEIAKGELLTPGDGAQPVTFSLRLVDCLPMGGAQTNRYTGTSVQDNSQPVITVSFLAEADADEPSLLKVSGVTGIGLMLRDSQGRQVFPGKRGEPQFVTPAQDELVYTATPTRTVAPLTTGPFRAVSYFQVSYD